MGIYEELYDDMDDMVINPYQYDDVTVRLNNGIGLLTAKGTIIYHGKVFSSIRSFVAHAGNGKSRYDIYFVRRGIYHGWSCVMKNIDKDGKLPISQKIYNFMVEST